MSALFGMTRGAIRARDRHTVRGAGRLPRVGLSFVLAAILTIAGGDRGTAVERTETGEFAVGDMSCAQLLDVALSDTLIRLSEPISAGAFTPPGGSRAFDLPAFCRVAATTAPAVNFEVWLPDDWNGKFQGVGNGGMAGTISYAAMATGLNRGYATVSTDTGHEAGDIPFDASWARGNPQAVEDFGHRALHVATVHGKTLTDAFYGTPPSYSYYVGCSKGGQQGLMEAQRYPEDYDGLIAGDPANDWTRFYAGAHLWYSQALLSNPDSFIPVSKLPLLGTAVNEACDRLDGIEDGILNDPRQCNFDPAVLTCVTNDDDDSCLTPAQVDAVAAIWSGVQDSDGEVIYPGLVPGGEASPGGWSRWVLGDERFASLHWRAGEGFFRHMVFEDLEWDFRTFDFDADLDFALAKVGPALDAADPDLRPLRDRGGKLLVYHGWSDPDISALASIDYYEDVVTAVADDPNREKALAETREFFRLFLVPGMGHCRGGPGPDQFDALSALEAWVERGVAPERIEASKVDNGEVVMTRPLCPYPEVAQWTGTGSPDDARNFVCRLDGQ